MAFSPIRAVGLQEEALEEAVQGFEKRSELRDPKALGLHVGF